MIKKTFITETLFIILGAISAGFGLRGFLLPVGFIDGGAVGISLLISETTGFSLSLLLILVNIPFIIFGSKVITRTFAIKTIFGIAVLAAATAFIPYPEITQDKLLVSVFGGLFLGTGIGLAIRGGGVIDGTEVLAIFISKKTGLTIGDIILIFNIIIFSVGAYLLSVEKALYAILTYFAASRTVNFIIEGIEEYTGVTIISEKWDEIRLMIINNLERGVTIYKGEKGFNRSDNESNEQTILFTIVTRLELSSLKSEIRKIDDKAFVFMHSINETRGGMIKKRPFAH